MRSRRHDRGVGRPTRPDPNRGSPEARGRSRGIEHPCMRLVRPRRRQVRQRPRAARERRRPPRLRSTVPPLLQGGVSPAGDGGGHFRRTERSIRGSMRRVFARRAPRGRASAPGEGGVAAMVENQDLTLGDTKRHDALSPRPRLRHGRPGRALGHRDGRPALAHPAERAGAGRGASIEPDGASWKKVPSLVSLWIVWSPACVTSRPDPFCSPRYPRTTIP
jgi:hypothetical protein